MTNYSYYLNTVRKICAYCKIGELRLDDIDYRFNGNQDEYLWCPHCRAAVFCKVRFGKVIYQKWEKEI